MNNVSQNNHMKQKHMGLYEQGAAVHNACGQTMLWPEFHINILSYRNMQEQDTVHLLALAN